MSVATWYYLDLSGQTTGPCNLEGLAGTLNLCCVPTGSLAMPARQPSRSRIRFHTVLGLGL